MKTREELTMEAIEHVRPQIEEIMAEQGRSGIYIVVTKPWMLPENIDLECWIQRGILAQRPIGDIGDKAYDDYARHKAFLSWRYRMSMSSLLTDEYIHLLKEGDILFRGSYYADHFAVGVSGLPESVDVRVATLVHGSCKNVWRAYIKERLDQKPYLAA